MAARARARDEASNSSGSPISLSSGNPGASSRMTSPPHSNPRNSAILDDTMCGTTNVLEIPPMERKMLGEGPIIKIYDGRDKIIEFPRRLFFAASTLANQLVAQDNRFHLPPGADRNAILRVLAWLDQAHRKNRFELIPRVPDFDTNLRVCHAARMLGMTKYVQHLIDKIWASIANKIPTVEMMEAVEGLGVQPDEVFVTCMGRRVQYVLRKNKVDVDAFTDLLAKFPKIEAVVKAIDDQYPNQPRRRGQCKQRSLDHTSQDYDQDLQDLDQLQPRPSPIVSTFDEEFPPLGAN